MSDLDRFVEARWGRSRDGNSGLKWAVGGSVGAHFALALGILLWRLPPSLSTDEVPATVQVLFGNNADAAGVAAASPAPARPEVAKTTPSPPPDGEAPPAAPVGANAAPNPTVPLPVRLGDGDVGLKLSGPPDAGLIEAEVDPGNRAPKYPNAAWLQRQHGRVVIRMHIDTEGRVAEAEVLESSGHPALDRAAREALARWHFIPALRDGVAVPSFRDQATNFVLE